MTASGGRAKVIHVITRLDLGGAQGNTLYTAAGLDARRFDCLVVAGEGGTLEPEARGNPSLKLRLLPSLKWEISPGQDLLALLQLWNIFLAEKPAVVHTHSSKAGILGRLAAWLAGVPLVIHTYHGFGFNDFQSAPRKGLYLLAERLACRVTDRIIFVSESNRVYARRHRLGDPERYLLLRSGIKLSDYPAKVENPGKLKASLGLGMHKPMVASIGNLKPQKNPGDFVALARLVAAENPDARFLFIGDGPLRPRLECQMLAAGLHGRLTLAGWRRDTPALLAASEIFVLTSLWEGLPRALVEAMKSGLPCVCYATDGVTDILKDGENGFVVPVGDLSLMSRRVLELLRDPALRKRLGDRAAASIGPEFDIDLMVRAQEELYEGAPRTPARFAS